MSLDQDLSSAGARSGGCGVPSPCNSVCRMDEVGAYCLGCGRTLAEIAGWAGFDDEQRRQVWRQLSMRKARQP